MKFNCELLELSFRDIDKLNTRKLRLQSKLIISYIKLNFFHTYNCLHCSSKRLDRA